MRKAEDQKNLVEIAKVLPEEARDPKGKAGKKQGAGASGKTRASRVVAFLDEDPTTGGGTRTNGAGVTKKSAKKVEEVSKTGEKPAKKPKSTRAKAKTQTEKFTPAYILKKLIAFGKDYQIENEQDFREAARIYSEEAALIDQMRKRLKEDGLTVLKTYKTGDCEVAHPLLSELPRHVESANKCLMTISSMIEERGAKKQKPTRDLDQFRLHA